MLPGNNIKEVVIHVGLEKTGTSSIQNSLYNEDNNKLLLNKGILYPRCWKPNHGRVLCSAFSSHPERLAPNRFPKVLSKEEIQTKDNQSLKKFESTINNSTAKRLILSGEVIPNLSKKNLEKMKDYLISIGLDQAEFKIMLYTRNPVTWTISTIQQSFKSGVRYDASLNKRKNQIIPTLFQDKISKFMEVFGEESVCVYPFEKAREHGMGIMGHFLKELNVDKKVIKTLKQIRTNDSVSMFTGDFLEYINGRIPLMINGKHNSKRHRSDDKPLLRIRGDKFDIPLTEKKEIASAGEQDMTWLKVNFGIDYSKEKMTETDKYKKIDTTFEDIEKIYPILTKTIRDILLEFMEQILLPKLSSFHKDQCLELIIRLKKLEEDLVQINRQEEKLQNQLNINNTDKGLMYRELALLMEVYDQYKAAELLMEKASLYRPNVKFIENKIREYKQKS